MILSASSPAELCNTIANGDERMLKSVKGIGLKTAQRIIVDLRDKIATLGIEGGAEGKRNDDRQGVSGEEALQTSIVRDEAIQALLMLGFSPAPSAKVVNAILKDQPSLPVEQVVKLALKMIK